mmetsp:Transcript_48336/g.71640  ORF Transcript_48336/g.71640 Transcript_48336/m.71640 type:complete len:100 (+) Transcript_48336:1455-1754(+)
MVKVLPSQVSVSRCSSHFKHAIIDGEQCHIKRAAPQIKNQYVLFMILLIESVRNRCCGWFVDHTFDLQSSNGACILGGLALSVVEVCGDSHYRVVHRGA